MAAQKKVELFSGRVKKVPARDIRTQGLGTGEERTNFLKLSEAEPNLFVPWRRFDDQNQPYDISPTASVNTGSIVYPSLAATPTDPTLRAMLLSDNAGNRSWTDKIAIDSKDNMIINTNLFVNGTTIQVNTVSTTIDDSIIQIGGDTQATSGLIGRDSGVAFRWWDEAGAALNGDASGPQTGFFGFQYDTKRFVFIPRGTENAQGKFVGDTAGTLGAALELTDLVVQNIYSPDNTDLRLYAGANGTVKITSPITEGTWNADVIGVEYGGTGLPELNPKGVVYGNGSEPVGVTNSAYIDGSILQADLGGNPYFSNIIDCGSF
jgi:hypothetical protein